LIIECVPNFSEGRDPVVISTIARSIESIEGVLLLNKTSDPDHNRSVLTFAGHPARVAEGALAAVKSALEHIDLSRHSGVHPRIGAVDVLPFVPVHEIPLSDCVDLARAVGARIWEELAIPVFLYEAAAMRPKYSRLENIRRLAPLGLAPDFGTGRHSTAGATVVGARRFLIAWNINLRTTDIGIARAIAREIRESSGGLPSVKALGLPLLSRGQVQVSINLIDFEQTPLHIVFEAVAERSRRFGVQIAGSELVGMIPAAALARSAGHDLQWENLRPELILENRLQIG
jgi:glutamate formiminotransferase